MARVYLTGGLRMDGPEGSFVDHDLPGAQGRVAFAILIVERMPVSRDALAAMVWDDDLPDQWNAALTTVISKIRSLVNRVGIDGRSTVRSAGGTCAIVLPPETWVDLEDAQRRLDRAEGALRHGDLPAATSEASVASTIYKRPMLAGVVSNWVDDQRRQQESALYRCYLVLADAWLQRCDYQLAATIASQAVQLDPYREVGHRLLISAEWQRGDRGAALVALARCEKILRDELGISPSPETVKLAAVIRS